MEKLESESDSFYVTGMFTLVAFFTTYKMYKKYQNNCLVVYLIKIVKIGSGYKIVTLVNWKSIYVLSYSFLEIFMRSFCVGASKTSLRKLTFKFAAY